MIDKDLLEKLYKSYGFEIAGRSKEGLMVLVLQKEPIFWGGYNTLGSVGFNKRRSRTNKT